VTRKDFAIEVHVAQRVVTVDKSDAEHDDVEGEVIARIF